MMRYEIIEVDGTPFISADTIETVSAMVGTTPKRQAEADCAAHNQEAGIAAFKVRRFRASQR